MSAVLKWISSVCSNKNLHPAPDGIVDRNRTTSCPDLRPSGAGPGFIGRTKDTRASTTLQQQLNRVKLHGNDIDDVTFTLQLSGNGPEASVCGFLLLL